MKKYRLVEKTASEFSAESMLHALSEMNGFRWGKTVKNNDGTMYVMALFEGKVDGRTVSAPGYLDREINGT